MSVVKNSEHIVKSNAFNIMQKRIRHLCSRTNLEQQIDKLRNNAATAASIRITADKQAKTATWRN